MITKAGGTITGAVGGVAMGGVAMVGGATVGMLASRAAGNQSLQEAAQKKGLGGFASRMALRTANYGSKASFDIRKTAAGKKLSSESGINFDKGLSGAVGLGTAATAGGFTGRVERKAEEIKKNAELYKTHMSDDQVRARTAKEQNDFNEKKNQAKQAAIKNGEPWTQKEEDEFEKGRPKAYSTAAQVNADRMKKFQENIGKTGLVGSLAYSITAKPTDKEVAEAKEKHVTQRTEAQEKAKKEQGTYYDEKTFNQQYDAKHKEPTKESMMDSRVTKTKMAIGAALAVSGFGASAGAGIATAAIVGGTAYDENFGVTAGAEKKAKGAMEKEIKAAKTIEDRLTYLKTEMEKITKLQKEIGETAQAKDWLAANKGKTLEDYAAKESMDLGTDIDNMETEMQFYNKKILELKDKQSAFRRNNAEESAKNLDNEINELDEKIKNAKKNRYDTGVRKQQMDVLKNAEEKLNRIAKDMDIWNKNKHHTEEKGHKKEEAHEAPPKANAPTQSPPSGGGGHGGGGHGH